MLCDPRDTCARDVCILLSGPEDMYMLLSGARDTCT